MLGRLPILPIRWRDEGEGIEDGGEAAESPLLAQAGGQNPLALRLGLDLEGGVGRLPRAGSLFQQLDLLVGVDVKAVRGQAGEQRAGEQVIGEGRAQVGVEGGPGVLVGEVVADLGRERVQTRQVRGRRSELVVLDNQALERRGLHGRCIVFQRVEPRHAGPRSSAVRPGQPRSDEVIGRVGEGRGGAFCSKREEGSASSLNQAPPAPRLPLTGGDPRLRQCQTAHAPYTRAHKHTSTQPHRLIAIPHPANKELTAPACVSVLCTRPSCTVATLHSVQDQHHDRRKPTTEHTS